MPFYKNIYTISFLSFLLVFFPKNAFAEGVEIKNFKLLGNPDKYQVHARVAFELNNYLHKALLNGVELNARVQIRLGEHRSWWFNKDTTLITVKYKLKYHALSQHYLLSRSDTGENWSFSTLPETLRKLGELQKFSLPPIKEPIKNGDYYIFAIADIGPAVLRLPLRIQALFSDEYRLTSEGVLWPLP